MSKYNITSYNYKWDNYSWFIEPPGSNFIKEKLDGLKKYLTFDKKQTMSKYEVRLYEWILKKQYKADPIRLYDEIEDNLGTGLMYKLRVNERYYLGYYNPIVKSNVHDEDRYIKEQQKNRARFHSKMGR
jgi:hypothetical protein